MSDAPEIRPSRSSTDDEGFKRELVQLIPHLRAFARTLCGDATAADDLAQDAMMKAWDARASFQMGTNMKAWTFMILRNQFYSEKRRSWRQTQLDQEAAERTLVAVDDPEAPVALDELRQGFALFGGQHRQRGSRRDLRLCSGHGEEPGQPRPAGPARHPGFRILRPGRRFGRGRHAGYPGRCGAVKHRSLRTGSAVR
jgi:RNA polymerase sigma factor (sigma-70 family)